MKKETKNNVREWTYEDEMFKLTPASPNPPLGASKKVKSLDIDFDKLSEMQRENRKIMENLKQATETPMFSQSSEDIAKTLSDAGIKAAKATHEFNMMEIKAKLIADLCKELVKMPVRHEDVPQRAREIADKALENL
jgi:hypothetical protein